MTYLQRKDSEHLVPRKVSFVDRERYPSFQIESVLAVLALSAAPLAVQACCRWQCTC